MASDRLRWDDVEIFCLLAEFGSIRQAAAHCGQGVETIRRRINALEVSIGERLFRRTAHGLAITQAGSEILAEAQRARDAVLTISRRSGANRQQKARAIGLSVPEDLGGLWLLPALHRSQPGSHRCAVHCELRGSSENVAWSKTDIAIQFSKPDEPDLICRKIGVLRYALFCRRELLCEAGPNADEAFFQEAPLVLPGEKHPFIRSLEYDERWRDRLRRPQTRVDSAACALNILSAAKAVAVMPAFAARNVPWLAQLPEGEAPTCEVELWIAFHDDIRRLAAQREFLDLVIELVKSNPDLQVRETRAVA